MKYRLLLLLLIILALSCGRSRNASSVAGGVADTLHYATNITIAHHDGWTEVWLRNPWDTAAVLHTYLLVPSEAEVPKNLPEGTLVRTPLRRAGVATAVACGLIEELGRVDAIAGVCEQQYIHQTSVQQGLKEGRIADFGSGMNPDIEHIMETAPDALLLTPFEHSGGYGRVERLGIPIIECAEYMETSALGRAEWIRFYALLFGAEAKGDSIFRSVEQNYLRLVVLVRDRIAASQRSEELQPMAAELPQSGGIKVTDETTTSNGNLNSAAVGCNSASAGRNSARSAIPRQRGNSAPMAPSLLSETLYGGQWFVPCGQSTMGRMYADAGADYPFADMPGSGSVGLSFEEVLERAQDADVWLIKYNQSAPVSYESLARDYKPYTQFRAWRERHIWACDLAATHFYEETPFHPDRLLRDLVIILHPELMPGEETRYYKTLPPPSLKGREQNEDGQ